MRKRLITLITIASLAILAVGCGSTDRNANDTTENQNSTEISSEAVSNSTKITEDNSDKTTEAITATDTSEADAYIGTWGCGRATLVIDKSSDSGYTATINWADSASAYSIWEYSLVYNPDNGNMVCTETGKKTYVQYKDENSEPESSVEYTDGSATFSLVNNAITWDDTKENSGKDMSFTK